MGRRDREVAPFFMNIIVKYQHLGIASLKKKCLFCKLK